MLCVVTTEMIIRSIPEKRGYSPDITVKSLLLSYVPICLVFLATNLPGLIVANVDPTSNYSRVEFNFLGYTILAIFLIIYVILILIQTFKKINKIELMGYRIQAKYLTNLFLLFVNIIVFFDVILNVVGRMDLSWIGILLCLPILIIGFYAIVCNKLYDIKLISIKTLAYVLSVVTIIAVYVVILSCLSFATETTKNVSVMTNPINLFTILVLLFLFQPIKNYFDKTTRSIFYKDSYTADDLLMRLNKQIASTSDLRILLERMSYEISNIIGIKQVFFVVFKGSSKYISAGTIHHKKIPLEDLLCINRYIKDMKRTREKSFTQLSVNDVSIERMMASHRIFVVVPLVENNVIIGYFFLGEKINNSYTNYDLKILDILSNEFVIAVQNSVNIQEVKELNENLKLKIEEATKNLRLSNFQLQKLDEAKDEFISMTSHQLRTPLTSVKGYIDMVLDGDAGPINDNQRQLLSRAFASSERMVYLIGDFLNLSRIQTGKFIIEKHATNLEELIIEEIDNLESSADQRDLTFKFNKPSPKIPFIMLDEDKIRQVVMNFLDNALYYSKEGTVIEINLYRDIDDVVLTVKDYGIGVPDGEQENIFNKFFRATNAKKHRPDGTGIGLYLSKKIVTAHGGSMIFSSTESEGSVFGFRLPFNKLRVEEGRKDFNNKP